jgi:PadR family transcriptional regulator, regulatory protein PadR
VPRTPDTSSQTITLLRALGRQGRRWHHGYELGKETGLKSGSLYPILIRLADRGLLETDWEEAPPRGRPPRHLYRLTAAGEGHLALLEAGRPPQDRTRSTGRGAMGLTR